MIGRGRGRARSIRRLSVLLVPLLAAALTASATASASSNEGDGSGRIVGGSPTTVREWPWQTAVARNDAIYPGNAFQRQFCGASLVAATLAITAAHCVFDFPVPGVGFNPANQFEVITGRTILSSSEGQVSDVAEVYHLASGPGGAPTAEAQSGPNVGPDLFNPNTLEWDVALLQLSTPSASPTIKLAGGDETATWTPGRAAFVTGWGTTSEGGSKSDQLRSAQVAMIADSACASPSVYGGGFFPAFMVCAGVFPQGGVDTCQGDSGGPLLVPVEEGATATFRLVGDTSFGLGCARPNFPGVYGRIADDPMRSALRDAGLAIAGVDIVGSGARPAEPPDTTITEHPRKKSRKRKAKFEFIASEPATFLCRLDGKQPEPCGSPFTKKVKRKRHELEITAIDSVGNPDPAPATFHWRVKRKR